VLATGTQKYGPEILIFSDHLQVKALAALQLDTYVYCGHTSGADILWAGVPTLSLPRVKQSARVGASLLRGLNLHTTMVARNLGVLFCYHYYQYFVCLFICLSSSHTELVVIIYFPPPEDYEGITQQALLVQRS
jgi:hypothetical protein